MKPTRLSPQVLILGLALLLWAVWPQAALWTLVAAYLAAWLILGFLLPRGRGLPIPLTPPAVLGLGALLLAAPAAVLWRHLPEVPWQEGTRGVVQHTRDRARLEALPAIAPAVVFDDHPQIFYLQAPGAGQVTLALGEGVSPLAAEGLGHGLFRVGYNPRQHGVLSGEQSTIEAVVTVDGTAARRPLARVRPLAHPRGLAADPARGRACAVSEETDELFLLDCEGLRHRVPVADGPVDCAFVGAEREWVVVAHRYTAELWWVDGELGTVVARHTAPPFAQKLAVSPEGTRLAVAVAGTRPGIHLLRLLRPASPAELPLREERFLPLDFPPDGLVFVGTEGEALVVSSAGERALFRYRLGAPGDEVPGNAPQRLYLGRPAVTLAASAPGAGPPRLYVAVTDYRPDGQEHHGNHFIQDQILTLDPVSWQVLGQYFTARRTPRQTEAGSLDQGISPLGIAVLEDGSLRVAFAGSDAVWHLTVGKHGPDGIPEILGGYDLDLVSPHGVADLGTDGTARYWAATTPAAGALAVYRGAEFVAFEGVTPPDDALAEAPPGTLDWLALELRVGERAFHETTRSGISCQSCHLGGGTDHSPHDIGQDALLHTLTTRGITRTAPYLRDASFPRVRELDAHLAQTLYRGYERDLPGRALALESYVESLPRLINPRSWSVVPGDAGDAGDAGDGPRWWRPVPRGTPVAPLRARSVDASLREGVRVYTQAGCFLCHTFPAFTNLAQHPRGSLFPELEDPGGILDTPSLLGLETKRPLLQDGRAEDFAAVLDTHNPANRHGDTAGLSAAEKSALVHFLENL